MVERIDAENDNASNDQEGNMDTQMSNASVSPAKTSESPNTQHHGS